MDGTGDGQFLNIGDEAGIEGIDVGSLGNFYVADSGNSRVTKIRFRGQIYNERGSNH